MNDGGDTEARFLAMIRGAPADHANRLIYADWLEEQGQRERAEFLRAACKLSTIRPGKNKAEQLRQRLMRLAGVTDATWRAIVTCPPIDGCPDAQRKACPMLWSALVSKEKADVRSCGTCERDVYFCASLEEVSEHARARETVAVDPTISLGSAAWVYERDRPLSPGEAPYMAALERQRRGREPGIVPATPLPALFLVPPRRGRPPP